ncbi:hypothetical protein [Streptomyces sp. NPDC002889]
MTYTGLYGNTRRKGVVMPIADALAPVLGAASMVLCTVGLAE